MCIVKPHKKGPFNGKVKYEFNWNCYMWWKIIPSQLFTNHGTQSIILIKVLHSERQIFYYFILYGYKFSSKEKCSINFEVSREVFNRKLNLICNLKQK